MTLCRHPTLMGQLRLHAVSATIKGFWLEMTSMTGNSVRDEPSGCEPEVDSELREATDKWCLDNWNVFGSVVPTSTGKRYSLTT